jgi:hypothetical protein
MNFIKLLAPRAAPATGAFGEYGRAFAIGRPWDRTHPACPDFITNPIDLFVSSHSLPWQPSAGAAFEQAHPFNPPCPSRLPHSPTPLLPYSLTPLLPYSPSDPPRPFRFIDTPRPGKANFW